MCMGNNYNDRQHGLFLVVYRILYVTRIDPRYAAVSNPVKVYKLIHLFWRATMRTYVPV